MKANLIDDYDQNGNLKDWWHRKEPPAWSYIRTTDFQDLVDTTTSQPLQEIKAFDGLGLNKAKGKGKKARATKSAKQAVKRLRL